MIEDKRKGQNLFSLALIVGSNRKIVVISIIKHVVFCAPKYA